MKDFWYEHKIGIILLTAIIIISVFFLSPFLMCYTESETIYLTIDNKVHNVAHVTSYTTSGNMHIPHTSTRHYYYLYSNGIEISISGAEYNLVQIGDTVPVIETSWYYKSNHKLYTKTYELGEWQ